MLEFKCYREVVTDCYYKSYKIFCFSQLLFSKHLKNTCEKGYFLVNLQVGSSFRYALFLNLSTENSAKRFSCRKIGIFVVQFLIAASDHEILLQYE